MKTMNFNDFSIDYQESMKVYSNNKTKKVIFVSENDDEIHGLLEFNNNNQIKIHPRWNVNFIIEDKKIIVDLNYYEE